MGLAVAEAEAVNDDGARTAALLTRAGNQFFAGDVVGGIDLATSLNGGTDQDLTAQIKFQLGTMLARSGDPAGALLAFDEAERAAAAAESTFLTAMVHKNRGLLRGQEGHVESAVEDLGAARIGFEALGMELELAFCDHNLGMIATWAGDLPSAFVHYAAAEPRIRELTGSDFESKWSHCQALLSAGLFSEAAVMSGDVAVACRQAGLLIDAADAQTLQSVALFQKGDLTESAATAEVAALIFQSQSRDGHHAAAEHIMVLCDAGRGEPVDESRLVSLIDRMRNAGLQRNALEAHILLAEERARSDVEAGLETLDALHDELETSPADLRIAAATARAAILDRSGRVSEAEAVAADGFETMIDYQSTLGSADLRSGVRHHTRRLGQIGLRSAIEAGDRWSIAGWTERVAVASSMSRPVVPVGSVDYQTALARLRAADPDDHERHRLLEDEIKTLARSVEGAGRSFPSLGIAEIAEALDDTVGVTFCDVGDSIVASVVADGEVIVHRLGDAAAPAKLIRSVRADLRSRAVRPGTGRNRRILGALAELDRRLLEPLGVSGRALVIAAPASLFAVPWLGLDSRIGTPTTVTTSLTSWANARPCRVGGPQVLVAGPDLDQANAEVEAIRAVRPDAKTFGGVAASSRNVLEAIESGAMAHLVCHGEFRADNPLFSSLQLADGPLSVYELDRLVRPPDLVVLSACHLGLPATDPERELLGLATSMLAAGTSCVIASTLPVPDSAETTDLMVGFHRRLVAGSSPAEAWAAGQRGDVDQEQLLNTMTFGVFGHG